MARIPTYQKDTHISDLDRIIGTDGDTNELATKNFFLGDIAEYVIDKFIDPDAVSFTIPVFRDTQDVLGSNATRITGSIISQDVNPGGTKIRIAGATSVKDYLTVNYTEGTFPRVFPPYDPTGDFNTEPTGRIGVINNPDGLEWAFSAVSVGDLGNPEWTNRSGILHGSANEYRLLLSNGEGETTILLNSGGSSFIKKELEVGALYLNGPVKDATNTPGDADQILVSDASGELTFTGLADLHVGGAEVVEVPVKNTQGSALTKGDPVYISGSVGSSGRLEVQLADASDAAKMPALGLLKQDLGINEEGFAVVTGKLRNLPTSPIDGQTPLANDVIYVKANGATGDALTLTKPTGSNLIQNMGKVGRVSTSNSGTFVVSSILRTNDIPNLTPGKIWVGSTANTIESAIVHLDEASGYMGIGTTNPETILEVVGENPLLTIRDSGTELPGANAVLRLAESSLGNTLGDYWDLKMKPELTGGATNFAIVNSSLGEVLNISYQGNVGIGATNPSQKLDVDGNIKMTETEATSDTDKFVVLDSGVLKYSSILSQDTNPPGTGLVLNGDRIKVDGTAGVKDSLTINYTDGTYPRVFPPYQPTGDFNTEPTGRIGVVNDVNTLEWAFSAVSIGGLASSEYSNRSGLLHRSGGGYRLLLSNATEQTIFLDSDGDSFINSGNLAIGHDTPTEKLDVLGDIKATNIRTERVRPQQGGTVVKINQANFFDTGNISNISNTDIGATLHLRTNEPLTDQDVIALTKGGLGTGFPSGIKQSAGGEYTFLLRDNSNSQSIKLASNKTTPSFIDNGKVFLGGNTDQQDGAVTINNRRWTNGVKNAVIQFNKSGTQLDTALEFKQGSILKGSISYDSTGTNYNVTSDYRVKENVVEITDGIERLKQLKPSKFNFITDTEKVVDGFIAHEVQDVVPEAVTGDKDATEEYEVTPAEYDDYGNLITEAVMGTRDAYQQIDQAKIVPLLTAALQEAITKIETLEAKVNALEGN